MVQFYLVTIAPVYRSEIMDYYGYIYLTENLINGHKYIGQHKSSSFDIKYYGSGKILRQAMKTYGKENFRVHILQWCKTKWELNAREIAWILMYDANHSPEFYNISRGGDGGSLSGKDSPRYGKTVSKESREKMSKSHIGLQLGIKRSDETKKKMSLAQRGENNPSAKLTNKQVLEIIELHKKGVKNKDIAIKYKVSDRAIRMVLQGKRWSNVTGIEPSN